MNDNQKRINYLVTLILDEPNNEKAIAELSELLNCEPDFIKYYHEALLVPSGLRDLNGVQIGRGDLDISAEDVTSALDVLQRAEHIARSRRINHAIMIGMSAAAVLMLGFFAIFHHGPKAAQAVATLQRSVDASWADSLTVPSGQSVLNAGEFSLEKGLAEIEFGDGISAVFKAPVKFTIKSPLELVLHYGNVVVSVNEHVSGQFVVVTPNADIIDFGTEFGVEVADSGNVVASVFEGEINIHGRGSNLSKAKLSLQAGQGGLIDNQGLMRELGNVSDSKFVRPAEFNLIYDEKNLLALGNAATLSLSSISHGSSSPTVIGSGDSIEIANLKAKDLNGTRDSSYKTRVTSRFCLKNNADNSERGDCYLVGIDNFGVDLREGIFIASVSQNADEDRNGTIAAYMASVARLNSALCRVIPIPAGVTSVSGNYTPDCASAYFPYEQGWTGASVTFRAGQTEPESFTASSNINYGQELVWVSPDKTYHGPGNEKVVGSGIWHLQLPGVNSRRDGVLLACSASESGSYASAIANGYGNGWTIITRRSNKDGKETDIDSFNIVFIPYETPGIAAGVITGYGGIISGTDNFNVIHSDKGRFRLTIENQMPQSGVLLVCGTPADYAIDNMVTYEADGDGWIVETRDLPELAYQDVGNANFAFAFLPFENTPRHPGPLRGDKIDSNIAAGEFEVGWNLHRNILNLNQTKVKNHLTSHDFNFGDYLFCVGGMKLNYKSGIMLSTICRNRRVSPEPLLSTVSSGGDNHIHMHQVIKEPQNVETNADFAVAWFPFLGDFIGGYIDTEGHLIHSNGPAALIKSEFEKDTGKFLLALDGINTTDGILFTITMSNTDNIAVAVARSEFCWEIVTQDSYAEKGQSEENSFAYVFLPYDTPKCTLGHVDQDGLLLKSNAAVSVSHVSTGTYRISYMSGTINPNSILILNTRPAIGETTDNSVIYYRSDEKGFLVRTLNPQTGNAQDCGFVFANVECE